MNLCVHGDGVYQKLTRELRAALALEGIHLPASATAACGKCYSTCSVPGSLERTERDREKDHDR